jgi:23S rRNA pseudouridine1911/1915/1917 synthase
MSAEVRVLTVEAAGRLDAFVLAAGLPLSRRIVHRLIADGAVRVNGRRAAKGTRVAPGDAVSVPWLTALAPEPTLPVRVVHVDAHVVALEKPGGMPSHALDPRETGTAAAYLVAHFPETASVGEPFAAGLVHRLDTGTSGLLLAARTTAVHAALREAFAARRVTKRYLAVVTGTLASAADVAHPLAHDPGDRRRMRVARPGEASWPAHTHVEPLARDGDRLLVAATIRTGVTHQVRVHLASLGLPVVGDRLYGGADAALSDGRHALHASALTIAAGVLPEPLALESELPDDLRELVPGVLVPGSPPVA